MMQYEIVKEIGRGSTSKVFLARYRLKRNSDTMFHGLSPKDGDINKENDEKGEVVVLKERCATQQAINEARILKTLESHPCVIQFIDAFHIPHLQKLCIATEVASCDLKQILQSLVKNGKYLLPSIGTKWLCQVSLGLGHLHSLGIVHRDVKPQNIFIMKDGRAVLGDLGTSKDHTFDELVGLQTFVGTPYYLAPEIVSIAFGSDFTSHREEDDVVEDEIVDDGGDYPYYYHIRNRRKERDRIRNDQKEQEISYGTQVDVWSFGCVAFELISSGRLKAFKPASTMKDLGHDIRMGRIQWRELSLVLLDHYNSRNLYDLEDKSENQGEEQILNEQREMIDTLIRPTLQHAPCLRLNITDILHVPLMVRSIGCFMAEFRSKQFRLDEKRANCLLNQLKELDLSETVLAGFIIGKDFLSTRSLQSSTTTTSA